jgi:hypothetical protein
MADDRARGGRGAHPLRLLLGDNEPGDVTAVLLRDSAHWEAVQNFLGFEERDDEVVTWSTPDGGVIRILAEQVVGISTGGG